MIKSISYWSMPDGLSGKYPVESALRQAQSHGFEGLELCIGLDGILTPESLRGECEAYRRMVEESELAVETLASGMSWAINPASSNTDTRDEAIRIHSAGLRRAAWLGCKAMLFVPGVVTSPISPQEEIRYDVAVQRVRVVVSRLLETAEECQVDLCLENVWNGLFLSPLELAEFVDSFDTARLGVYLDVGNLLRYHQHPAHWIEILGPRIKRVHVKDFKEYFGWSGSYEFCNLGEGDVPWLATMEALARIGYDGPLVAEMLPYREGLLESTSRALDTILALTKEVRDDFPT